MKNNTYIIWLEKKLTSEQVREYLEEICRMPVTMLTENYEVEVKGGDNSTGFQLNYHEGMFKTEIYIWNPPEGLSENRIEEIRLAQKMATNFDCKVLIDATGYENYSQKGFDPTSTNDSYSLVVDQRKIVIVDDSDFDMEDADSNYSVVETIIIKEL